MRRPLAAFVGLAVLAVAVPAHFVWGVHRSEGVRFEFSENPGDSILENFAGKGEELKLVFPKGSSKLVKQDHFVTLAGTTPLVGARLDYGVLDKGESGKAFNLIYHIKSADSLASAAKSADMPIEIFASRHSNTEVKIKVLWNGKPAPEAEVVYGCQKAKETTTKTDSKGEAVLAGILPNKVLFVRSFAAEAKKGELNGKKYETIRHYATLAAPTGSNFSPAAKE